MQSLDVISVNIWQMAASLANLVLLFLIVKKFLYKPVKNMLKERRSAIDNDYKDAADAKEKAVSDMKAYEEKLSGAHDEANAILKGAVDVAKSREKEIIDDANEKARGIIKRAEADALLEKQKAREDIKREIVEVSTLISEKMLEREISADDHEKLIDSFIDNIGNCDEAN
jgi:F-type H+-transporting ATPase subunit b